jgi:S1-C subfamily serine protease
MRTLFLIISALVLALPAGASANDKLHGSILQVFVTSTYPNHNEPWQSYGQFRKSGSGVIIAGNRILTNAHVVQDASFIEVKKANDTRKYIANLEVIAHDMDLALLTVADRKFYDSVTPLEIGVLPNLRDKVAVYGFPQGGTTLSVTEGIVSRIEVTETAQDSTPVLAIQIDAAVNYGNSGGPVLLAGKVVGIAFQSLSGGQNINYILSSPVIDRFLKDIADGAYDGVPDIEADVQIVENEDMKRFYGLTEGRGIFAQVHQEPAARILRKGM